MYLIISKLARFSTLLYCAIYEISTTQTHTFPFSNLSVYLSIDKELKKIIIF